jgi:hypothetical protein
MSTLSTAQRLKFLERVRAKKARPDNKVDVLCQLEVADGDNKKKRKENPERINVEIPGKGCSAAVVADEAVEAGGETHVKSPVKKKRSLNKKDKDSSVLEKDLWETEAVVAETAPIVANHARGARLGILYSILRCFWSGWWTWGGIPRVLIILQRMSC